MFEALIIVLREGVEAALVLAIVLAYLRRTGRDALAPWVYAGVGFALVASVACAFGLEMLAWDPEAFEGVLMLAGAACVITLVLWMKRAAKGLKREIEAGVERSTSGTGPGWGLLVFCGVMILREGVETVLFLAATSFNTDGLARLVGAGIGLGLAVLFAVFLVRGSLRVDLGRFFRVTTIVLYVLAFQLIVGGLHELSESGVLPSSQAEMALVGPIVRHDTHLFVTALVLAIAFVALAPATASRATQAAAGTPATEPAGAPESGAARRLELAAERRLKRSRIGALAIGLLVVGILSGGILAEPGPPPKAQAVPVVAQGEEIVLDAATLGDGHMHFFSLADAESPGGQLRFFALRKPDGTLQACMDACEICGDQGYYEDAQGVTCRNCSAPINLITLGQSGGCNPIPVAAQLSGGHFIVNTSSLRSKRTLARGKR